jgi:hypothetical protein
MMEARLDLSLHKGSASSFSFLAAEQRARTNNLPKSPRPRPPPLNLLSFVRCISKDVILPPSFPPANQGCERKRSGGDVGGNGGCDGESGEEDGGGGQCVGGRKES